MTWEKTNKQEVHCFTMFCMVRCVERTHKSDMKVSEMKLEQKFICSVLVSSGHERMRE